MKLWELLLLSNIELDTELFLDSSVSLILFSMAFLRKMRLCSWEEFEYLIFEVSDIRNDFSSGFCSNSLLELENSLISFEFDDSNDLSTTMFFCTNSL